MANNSKSQSVAKVRDSSGEFFRSYPQLWDEIDGSFQTELFSGFNDEQRANAEKQILEHQRIVDYDTKEYPVETVVAKYLARKREDDNELFVPDYQRDFTWSMNRQSKFIESMLIGLPIPYIFVADVTEKEARLEIVDGSQRIRTLAAFITNQLILEGLEKLSNLNGFRFCDLEVVRQRRFLRRTIHMIELSEEADEAVRRDVFERINTGSDVLRDMEVRRGLKSGPFLDLIESCASNALFKELAPLSEYSERRREREEFVLRFFAYLENYNNFEKRVREFLDAYMAQTQDGFNEGRAAELRAAFMQMLQFVQQNFPYGFRKAKNHVRTPRIRFEAISVGVALALRQNPQLKVKSLDWLESDKFKEHTTSDASNSRPKVIGRIEFVRDQLLANQ
jgi:hypothetical protein